MTVDDVLSHHGIKGMRWGHRKIIQSNNHVENRKVNKSDIADITKLLNDLPAKDKKFLALDQKMSIIKQNIRDEKHSSVATINGKIVGFMRESGRPNGFVLLEELVVDPKCRNSGIASKMINDFHSMYPKTLAKTKANNKEMKNLLEKNGYKADNPNSKTVINWIRDNKHTKREKKVATKVLDDMLAEEIQHSLESMGIFNLKLEKEVESLADKSRSIKNASDAELDELLIRLEKERRAQCLISELQRAGVNDLKPYDNVQVSTEQPIETLYHYGVLGMHWGKRGGTGAHVSDSAKHLQSGKNKVTDWLKEAGKLKLSDLRHPIITKKANLSSIKADTWPNKFRRTLVYQNTKDLKDVNQRVETLLAEKKNK